MLWLNVVGTLLIIVGWVVQNSTRLGVVDRVISRRYSGAMDALGKVHKKDFILKKGDRGFSELAEIIVSYIEGDEKPIVKQLKTLEYGTAAVSTDEGIKWMETIKFEVSFEGYPPLVHSFRELKEEVKERFRERGKFVMGALVFWCGVIINIVAIIFS